VCRRNDEVSVSIKFLFIGQNGPCTCVRQPRRMSTCWSSFFRWHWLGSSRFSRREKCHGTKGASVRKDEEGNGNAGGTRMETMMTKKPKRQSRPNPCYRQGPDSLCFLVQLKGRKEERKCPKWLSALWKEKKKKRYVNPNDISNYVAIFTTVGL
jgi:hypothetical protein